MKKITAQKLLSFVRNKYYGINHDAKVRKAAQAFLLNYDEYSAGLHDPASTHKKYILRFTSGLMLACRGSDLSAIAETCLLDDYGKLTKTKGKENMIIFDIGAHIGSFTMKVAMEGAHVYAFEPDKDNYELLLENIKLNKLEARVTPCNIAITEKTGTGILRVNALNPGGHSLFLGTSQDKMMHIPTKSLEDVMKEFSLDTIDLIKIDIEGSEYVIFQHMSKETMDKISTIVGEYHLSLSEPRQNFSLIKNYLSKSFPHIDRYDPYYFYAKRTKV